MALDPRRDAVYILNDPFTGGSHLPDVTLVSRTPVGFAVAAPTTPTSAGWSPRACRAFSRELYQEGIVLPPVELTPRSRRSSWRTCATRTSGCGDLRAQIAAHRLAERRLAELVERRGAETVRGGDGRAVRVVGAARPRRDRRAARRPRRGVGRARSGRGRARAPGRRRGRGATRSRSTSPVPLPSTPGNLNCPLAVTRSACYFVVRCLTDPDLPASGGAFAPVTVTAPRRLASSTRCPPAAVVAGNVETSSRIVDVVFAAFVGVRRRPGAGPGDRSTTSRFGNERLHLLRDDRRRPGRLPRRGRPVGRPRRDLEHAEHAGRGARARLSAARRALRAAHRLGRRGRAPRRRRRRPRAPRARGLPLLRSSPSAARTRRRAPPAASPALPGRNLLNGEELPAKATVELRAGDIVTVETPGGGGYGRYS